MAELGNWLALVKEVEEGRLEGISVDFELDRTSEDAGDSELCGTSGDTGHFEMGGTSWGIGNSKRGGSNKEGRFREIIFIKSSSKSTEASGRSLGANPFHAFDFPPELPRGGQLVHLVRHILRLRDRVRLRRILWLVVRGRLCLRVCGGVTGL